MVGVDVKIDIIWRVFFFYLRDLRLRFFIRRDIRIGWDGDDRWVMGLKVGF